MYLRILEGFRAPTLHGKDSMAGDCSWNLFLEKSSNSYLEEGNPWGPAPQILAALAWRHPGTAGAAASGSVVLADPPTPLVSLTIPRLHQQNPAWQQALVCEKAESCWWKWRQWWWLVKCHCPVFWNKTKWFILCTMSSPSTYRVKKQWPLETHSYCFLVVLFEWTWNVNSEENSLK